MRKLIEKEIVLATHNKGKVAEMQTILAPFNIKVRSADELNLSEPEENGKTFIENAKIKALCAAKEANMPALADDSGLCVHALNNRPGIYSARYNEPKKNGFPYAMECLNKELGDSQDRSAHFACALVIAWPDGHTDDCLYMLLTVTEMRERVNRTDPKVGRALVNMLDSKKVRGCDASTGSLGHGLPMGVGMALGLRYQKVTDSKVVVLMGDGEQNEGSVWEAAMAAAHYKLKNLIAIVDRNKLMIDGPTEEVMGINPIDKKYEAFGFKVIVCNGNDMESLDKALAEAWANTEDKPVAIIAQTEKGYGVKRFQGKVPWHYGAMNSDLFKEAVADIEAMD